MNHADLATLLAYWAGELDAAAEAEIERHYLGCDECSARLAEIEALASGVRRAFSGGHVGAVLAPAFVEKMRAAGLRLREYHVPCNGSINCTVAPEDDILLSRLQAPLAGVRRIDLLTEGARLADVPFDAQAGEVVVTPGTQFVRTLPAHRQVMRLVSVEEGGDRVLGDYTFDHSPH
jgi:hypothetical protein